MICKRELLVGDQNVKGDVRTMVELAKIAGTIYECLNFTSDAPSSQVEGKVPVLDLQVGM